MKIYIIAGEASGDLHASNLLRALKKQSSTVEVRYWGGDLMEEVISTPPVKHYKELAFMGFSEVITHLPEILGNFTTCKKDILQFQPGIVVLVDYPGFNLRIAKWAKLQGFQVHYYISPKVWAWKKSRVFQIKKYVDKLYTIFPFETAFFKEYEYNVTYVGNPLIDAINHYKSNQIADNFHVKYNLSEKPIIALLPGSRKQEIRTKLPVMLEATKQFENYQLIIAGAPSFDASFYAPYLEGREAKVLFGATYSILENAESALVTSGTATLETALFHVPQVVCYIASPISYAIAKRLIKIKYISLVNLIFDKEVVPELIQHECTPEKVKNALKEILQGGTKRNQQLNEYKELTHMLGNGSASAEVAKHLLLSTKNS
jgi:lipid-A-disaccharide synthase